MDHLTPTQVQQLASGQLSHADLAVATEHCVQVRGVSVPIDAIGALSAADAPQTGQLASHLLFVPDSEGNLPIHLAVKANFTMSPGAHCSAASDR